MFPSGRNLYHLRGVLVWSYADGNAPADAKWTALSPAVPVHTRLRVFRAIVTVQRLQHTLALSPPTFTDFSVYVMSGPPAPAAGTNRAAVSGTQVFACTPGQGQNVYDVDVGLPQNQSLVAGLDLGAITGGGASTWVEIVVGVHLMADAVTA